MTVQREGHRVVAVVWDDEVEFGLLAPLAPRPAHQAD